MKIISAHTSEKGPVVKNSIPLSDNKNNDKTLSDAMFINNPEKSEDRIAKYTTHFGGSSQTRIQWSTALLAIINNPNKNEAIPSY